MQAGSSVYLAFIYIAILKNEPVTAYKLQHWQTARKQIPGSSLEEPTPADGCFQMTYS
jgi:hypothetical protein